MEQTFFIPAHGVESEEEPKSFRPEPEAESVPDSAPIFSQETVKEAASESARGKIREAVLLAVAAAGICAGLWDRLTLALSRMGLETIAGQMETIGQLQELQKLCAAPDLLKTGIVSGVILLMIGWCGLSAFGQPVIFLSLWIQGVAMGSFVSGELSALSGNAFPSGDYLLLVFPAVMLALTLWTAGKSMEQIRTIGRILAGTKAPEKGKRPILIQALTRLFAAECLCAAVTGGFWIRFAVR